MRSLHTLLPVLLVASCAAGTAVGDGFGEFWADFTTAVATDDASAVARLTRFPFLFEGEQRDSAAFADVYAALFTAEARSCLATAAPVPEDDGYAAFCGPYVYLFRREERDWRFAEFTADPEAGDSEFESADDADPPLGSWRIVDGRVAPWAPASDRRVTGSDLAGTRVTAGMAHVLADPPLGCANADLEFIVTPAEGLFQGNLPDPAVAAARGVGIERVPALTMRVVCDTGSFDYHHLPGDTLLLALDDVIWKLAPEPTASPAAAVRTLLAERMTAAIHFTPDSEEQPHRFTLGPVEADDERATVRVVFIDGSRRRPADFLLVRQGTRWLLDEVRYEEGVAGLPDLLER